MATRPRSAKPFLFPVGTGAAPSLVTLVREATTGIPVSECSAVIYATVIDNLTGDPNFIPGQLVP